MTVKGYRNARRMEGSAFACPHHTPAGKGRQGPLEKQDGEVSMISQSVFGRPPGNRAT